MTIRWLHRQGAQRGADRSGVYRLLCAALASIQILLPTLAAALPTDGQVAGGQATIQQTNPTTLTIQQATDKAILNWNSFSIAANEAVHFVQPSISSIALNRVIGVDPSVILGQLQSNGRVFLINPNGILFGAGAQINVGGLLATTLQIRDDDFMAGRYLFAQDPLKGLKSVVNQGAIHVSDHGFVVLAAPGVSNEGMIVANLGTAVLASSKTLTVDLMGDGLINYAISGKILDQVTGLDGTPLSSAVSNSGTIQADGRQVILSARASGDVFSSVVNQRGVIRARSLVNQEGVVRLDGGDSGLVQVAGALDASGLSTGQKGGQVSVLGQSVELRDSTNINVSGDVGGGRVLVGGNYQGQGPEPNAISTLVAAGASINADAISQGDGGTVIVWADGHTGYAGSISAKGGQSGGNGGFVEVSGKNTLGFSGRVDTSAPVGQTGTLLLDPSDITISNSANSNISAGPTFIGTALTSNLNVTTLQTALGTNNVIVDTTSPFLSAGNITVSNAVTWASANSLDLRAHNNITVNAGISSTGLGILRLIGNQDGIGGGNVALNAAISSRLGGIQLSGVGVTSNAAGTITTTGLASQNAGNVTISATGAVNLVGTVTANGGAAGVGTLGRAGGTIAITGVTGVTTGAITASGAAGNGANQAGGNAGTISVTNTTSGNLTTGTLTARTGNAVGTGAGGVAGSISVTQSNAAAGAFLQTGAINTGGGSNGAGGALTLSSQSALQFAAASIIQTTGGAAVAGNAGRVGGIINLSGTTVTTTGAIIASGSNGNGANQAGGNAGNISITSIGALTTSAGTLTASGGSAVSGNAAGGNGGTITMTNTSATTGNVTTGALTARSGNAIGSGSGGAAGSITVTQNNATGGATLQTAAINTSGGTKGAGGAVQLSSASNVNVTSTIATTGGIAVAGGTHAGAAGGNVTITGANRTVSGTITASGGAAIGTNQAGGNAGVVSSTGTGSSTTAAINSRTGAATGTGAGGAAGSLTLSGTTVSSGAINTSGLANGAGGNVSITSTTGTTTLSTVTTSGGTANANIAGRSAGTLTVNSAGNATTTTITASGSNGNGANQAGGNGGTVNGTSTGGNLTVGAISTVGGSGLAGNAAGGNGGAVTLDAGGATPTITHQNITTTGGNRFGSGTAGTGGAISIAAAALLSANTTLTATGGSAGLGTGGNVTFGSTVNGNAAGRTLAVNSNGTTTFTGAVGGTQALGSLTTNATGTVQIGGNVTTTGFQTYGDPVTLIGNSIMTGTTPTFGSTVAGGGLNLTLNFSGATTINGVNFTGINNFATGNGGATNLTGAFSTTGTQTYNDAVALTGATTLTSSGNQAVTFNNSVNGAQALAVNTSGATMFGGLIGNTTALTSLTTNAGGTTVLNGGSVTTTGAQTYIDAVTLSVDTTLNAGAGAITFGNTLNGAFSLAANSTGITTFSGAVGGTTALTSMTTNAGGTTAINGGAITTSGAQIYNDAVTLGANTTLTGTTPTFGSTVMGGGFDLALNFSGTTTINGANFTGVNNFSSGNGGTTQLTGAFSTSGMQTYDDAVSITGATTLMSSSNQAITLNNTVNGAQTLAINTTGTTTFSGAVGGTTALTSLTTNAGGTTAINGGSVTTSGNQTYNDNVTMNQATTLTSTGGTITFGGNATNNAAGSGITVDAPTINLTGGTTVATTGNGPISFFTDTLSPAGASINAGTGAISLAPNVLTRSIELGDVNTGRVTDVYYGSNFTSVTAGSFTIGRPTHTGNIFVTGVAAAPSAITVVNGGAGSVTFENAPYVSGNLNLGVASGSGGIAVDSNLTIGTGTLRLTTSGAITQTAGAITANIAGLSAGTGITLAQPANDVTTLAAQTTAGNLPFTDTNGFSLGSVGSTSDGFHPAIVGLSAAGTITLQSGGLVTQTQRILASALSLQGIGSYQLTNGANDVATLVANTTGNVQYNNASALVLGASTLSGSFDVITGGAITQSGAVTVTGTTTLAAGAANDITLTNAGNNFSTVGITSGNNVSLTDTNALVLGALTVSGNLNVTINGALTQSGAVTVTGTTTLAAGAANDITLTDAGNNFSTVGITSGNNVSLTDANALVLGVSTVSGNLALTTGGTLSQTAALAVADTTSFTATVANTDILLDTQANNFGGVVSFAGTQTNLRDVQLRNINGGATVPVLAGLTNLRNLTLTFDNAPITLPALTASGNLNFTAGGSINQSGALAVGGTTTLATTVAGSDFLLDTQANNFVGAVSFGGTTGNIRDVGVRNVNVGATIPSLAGLTNLRNLTLTFDNAPMALPALTLTAGGNLNVTAGGSITETGALAVPGTTTLATTVAGSDILLDTQANNFGGAVSFGGTQSNIRDLGLRNVNVGATVPALAGLTNLRNLTLTFDNAPMVLTALTASGNLTAAAGGLISQSGALTVAGNAVFDTTAAATLGSVNLANGSALTLGTSTVGGNLTVTTTAGDLTLPAGQTLIVVGDATLMPAGNVNLLGTTRIGGTQSSVGGGSSAFVLGADTNLNALLLPGTGNITVNTTGTTATFAGAPLLPQAINLNNTSNTFGGSVSVTTAAPAFTGTTTNTYNLTQSAPVSVNAGQSLTITDLGGTAGKRGSVTLTNPANNFDLVNVTGGNIALAETGPVTIGTVSANTGTTSTGTLSITSTGGITQTGAIVAASTTTLTAGANDITLINAGNSFSAVGVTSGNNVTLTDSTALVLGTVSVSGNLAVTTGGTLTQSGSLTVTGATTLASAAANSDILLDTQANNFGGGVAFGGIQTNIRDVSLRNVNAGATIPALAGLTNLRNLVLTFDTAPINLPTLNASGNLSATAGGSITQSGALTIGGSTTLATTVAGADILLDTQANNFGGAVAFGGTQANIRDIGLRNLNAGATISALAGVTNLRNLTLTFANAPIALPNLTASGNLNATAGGTITQTGALTIAGVTTLDAGANDITLTDATNNFSTVGITSGNTVMLTDANALTMNTSTASGNLTISANDLTIGGPVASTGGNLSLAGANTVTQLANLTAAGTKAVTVTTTTGTITMAAAATTTSGTGAISYTAGTDVTLGSLSTGGGVDVRAGGSVLSAAGSGTNVTAGANSMLQAFNGVVGTSARPITANVNPGTLSIRATTAVAGISAFLTGTVLPINALTLLNVPPGLVCFNGCPVPPSNNSIGGFFGLIPSFSRDSAVPWYLHEASDPPFISVVSTYLPETVVAEAKTDVKSDDQSVAREIPPCFQESACKPGASILTAPADGEDPELPAAK